MIHYQMTARYRVAPGDDQLEELIRLMDRLTGTDKIETYRLDSGAVEIIARHPAVEL